jgi:hypothetical protein
MKKLIISSLVFVLGCLTANAQWWGNNERVKGNGNIVTTERSVSDYDQVHVAGFFDVILVSGKEGELKIEAEENLLKHVITEVKGNSLKIYTEKGYNLSPSWNKSIHITVPFTDIDEVTLAGSGDINSNTTIKSNSFYTAISGSGDINLKIEANHIKGVVTGSGDLRLNGKSENAEYTVTGSGDIYAFDVEAQDVTAKVTGSGDIRANCQNKLTARVTGSGDIKYNGNPKKEDSKVSGSGDITQN